MLYQRRRDSAAGVVWGHEHHIDVAGRVEIGEPGNLTVNDSNKAVAGAHGLIPDRDVALVQFETIHPFVDGNGRTGRAIAHAMLRNKGLVTHTIVPLSAGLLVNTESYFAALAAYGAGDAGLIARRFADTSRYAAVTGRE